MDRMTFNFGGSIQSEKRFLKIRYAWVFYVNDLNR